MRNCWTIHFKIFIPLRDRHKSRVKSCVHSVYSMLYWKSIHAYVIHVYGLYILLMKSQMVNLRKKWQYYAVQLIVESLLHSAMHLWIMTYISVHKFVRRNTGLHRVHKGRAERGYGRAWPVVRYPYVDKSKLQWTLSPHLGPFFQSFFRSIVRETGLISRKPWTVG